MPSPFDYASSSGYARTRADWVDFPSTTTPITAAQLDQLDQAVADVKGQIVNLKDYGAVGDGTTDDTTAITNWLSDVATAGTGYAPPGTYKTDGGHTVPAGCWIFGAGPYTSTFYQRTATYCFRLIDESSPSMSGRISNLSIEGSTGSLAAVSGGIGVEISNGQRGRLDHVAINGFTSSGIGVRFRNVAGTLEYVEHSHLLCVQLANNTRGIQFTCDASAGTSFGYMNFLDVHLQVQASQTGIDVGGSGALTAELYNSRIFGQIHYDGNSGKGIEVTANGDVGQGTRIDLVGEILSGTGQNRIYSRGSFTAMGRFTPAALADDTTGTFQFIEEGYDTVALASRDIASATTITVPGGSDTWKITGTTNITTIAQSWDGRRVTLRFAGILTVEDNTANLRLAGNFVTSADDTLTLCFAAADGIWYEVARSVN